MIRRPVSRSLGLAACLTAVAALAAPSAAPEFGRFGFDVSGMNRAADPGDDFFAFANGGWAARAVIPADRSSAGPSADLYELSLRQTRDVVEAAAGDAHATGARKQVGDMYASFMDEAGIEARGIAPLKADLARIDAIATSADLAAAFGWMNRSASFLQGTRVVAMVPVRLGVTVDNKNPDAFVIRVGQGALGLPDRDYYLDRANPRFAEARAAYEGHVARMLALAGVPESAARAKALMALETAMAEADWSREQRRDPDKTYNPTDTKDLARLYPGLDWSALLGSVGLDGHPRVVVAETGAIRALAAMIPTVPLATWRAYLTYSLLNARAQALPKAFVDEDFALTKALSGTPVLRDRWKRGLGFVGPDYGGAGLGEAVGQLYVAKYFPPETKAKADRLVANLLAAMRIRLERLTWMAPETKAKALEKLAAFRPKIGYPDHWRDYSAIRIARDDAYGNLARSTEASYDRNVLRVDRPTDRGDWEMTPQTVNAYANPVWVEVVFPAAILRPPFFDPNADDAVNYGGIGAVIGHEISHHFDDQGSKYDAHGRLATWWTAEDVRRFKTFTDRVVAQYSAYEPLPGVHVKGENTLGENMADLAGINVAHDAWTISLKGRAPPVIDGFTGEQRFFLGFAQVWRAKYRDAAMLRALTSDEHTPGNWRPYVVRNLDAWYPAFGVRPGTKFYLAPRDRIKVW